MVTKEKTGQCQCLGTPEESKKRVRKRESQAREESLGAVIALQPQKLWPNRALHSSSLPPASLTPACLQNPQASILHRSEEQNHIACQCSMGSGDINPYPHPPSPHATAYVLPPRWALERFLFVKSLLCALLITITYTSSMGKYLLY